MISSAIFKIGLFVFPDTLEEKMEDYYKKHMSAYGRMCLLLLKAFGSYEIIYSKSGGSLLDNGSWSGLIGMLNRSEIDIALTNFYVTEDRNEAVYFSYPLNLGSLTFITKKPQYTPKIFAIFSTVSLSIWIFLAVSIIVVTLFSLLLAKKMHSLDTIVFNILAVCLNKPMIIKSSTIAENCFIYSYAFGIMFLTLCYNSVLLSFMTIPPIAGITNVKELAKAVANGEYDCITFEGSHFPNTALKSEDQNLRIIGKNIQQNPRGFGSFDDFFKLTGKNFAYIDRREELGFAKDEYFMSKDNLFQFLAATATTKNFCCKEQLDLAIHRVQAGGFLYKFLRENDFQIAFKIFSSDSVKQDALRKLTLTDLAPAFIFLISGYLIAFLALIAELVLVSRKKRNLDLV